MEQNLLQVLPSLNKCQRNWIDDSVTQEHINLLLQVAQSTPTKQNVNFFRVIAITNDNLKKEIFKFAHSEGIERDNNPNLMPNAVNLLYKNKEFIQKQVTGWIKHQIKNNVAPFNNKYIYEEFKCHRDVGFIVEALINDLRYQTNEKIRTIASSYYVNNVVQVRRFAENAAHNYMKNLISTYILKNKRAPLYQNSVSQIVLAGQSGELNTSVTAASLIQSFINVIQNGIEHLPAYIPGVPRFTSNLNNYNTQVLAPLLLIWCRNMDTTYDRIKLHEYDDALKLEYHVSLNIGISSGAVATAAQLLGYKTGFCGCFNPDDIKNILSNKLNIKDNNHPIIMLGIGLPEEEIGTNICVDSFGRKYVRRRQALTRANPITVGPEVTI